MQLPKLRNRGASWNVLIARVSKQNAICAIADDVPNRSFQNHKL